MIQQKKMEIPVDVIDVQMEKIDKMYVLLKVHSRIYLFNILDSTFIETTLKAEETLHQGYADFYTINNQEILVALFSYEDTMFFYCKNLVKLDMEYLKCDLKYGIFKNHFLLKDSKNTIVNISYSKVEIDNDIFTDVFELMKIKPYSNRLNYLHNLAKFYSLISFEDRKNYRFNY